ncbi:hypothetical protein GQ53DRAFT_829724 [Thozetella sp. PMI_491]|nr:hypothetical protein GQ53DRAFT_829724 [Thozetella sp. PMI_491]
MAWDYSSSTRSASPPPSPRKTVTRPKPSLPHNSSGMDFLRIGMDRERISGLLSPVLDEERGRPDDPPLLVHVAVRFDDPAVRSRYARTYGSSPNFKPTDRICNGLLRRIEHCSQELITRKDSTAFRKTKDEDGSTKPLRFELAFRMMRRDSGEWAERTFISYQKQSLTVESAKEILLSTHRIVGLFLRRHDKDFKWLDGSIREAHHTANELMSPSLNGPMSPLCVPPAVFVEASQSFQVTPGYHVELSLSSRKPSQGSRDFRKTLRVSSQQTAPLTLFASEDLLWKGLSAIEGGLEPRKKAFEDHLNTCSQFGCQHYREDAVSIELRVVNNLTPRYDHLRRKIRSKLCLFNLPGNSDCVEFLGKAEDQLKHAVEELDAKINKMNDFEFRILELKSMSWSISDPAAFYLDSEASYSRRTIEAALDRIQTGIGDVLRGHDIAIHFSAHKRGHLVIDKALVARRKGKIRETFSSIEEEKAAFMSRLKERIQHDLDTVCKDTCSVDDALDDKEEALLEADVISVVASESPPEDELSSRLDSLLKAGRPSASQGKNRPVMIHANQAFSISECKPLVPSKAEAGAKDKPNETIQGPPVDIPATKAERLCEESRPLLAVEPERIVKPIFVLANGRAQRVFPLLPSSYSPPTRLSSDSTLISELSLQEASEQGRSSSDEASIAQEQEEAREKLASPAGAHEEPPKFDLGESVEENGNPAVKATDVKVISVDDKEITQEVVVDAVPLYDEQQPLLPASRPTVDGEPYQTLAPDILGVLDAEGDLTSGQPASPVDEFARSKLDIMETLSETEEPDNSSLDLGDTSKCETQNSTDYADPEMEPSTAPSTPGLSSGGDSSPRYNMLTTPIYLQTLSSRKDPITPATEVCYDPIIPESSHSEANVAVGPVSAVGATSKGREMEALDAGTMYHYPRLVSLPEEAGDESGNQGSSLIDGTEAEDCEASSSDLDPGSPTLQLLRTAIVHDRESNYAEAEEDNALETPPLSNEPEPADFSGDAERAAEFSAPISEPTGKLGLEETLAIPLSVDNTEPHPSAEPDQTDQPDQPDQPNQPDQPDTAIADITAAANTSAGHECPEAETIDSGSVEQEPIGKVADPEDPNGSLAESFGPPVGVNRGPELSPLQSVSSDAGAGNVVRPAPRIVLPEWIPLTDPTIGPASTSPVPKVPEVARSGDIKGEEAPLTPGLDATHEGPYLAALEAPSARNSVSSVSQLSWSGSSKLGSRDSVEDVIPFGDADDGSDHHHEYRPQTAGYLGLHETRLVEVGLRGALGGARRYSLPLQSLPVTSDSAPSTPVPNAASLEKRARAKKGRKRRAKSAGALLDAAAGEQDSGERLLPRFMMLFAGMAVAGKLLNKQN